MKKSTPIFFVLSLLLILAASSCKDKCPRGFTSDGDDCKCPDGKFQAHGVCRELGENEYYAIAENCDCKDTSFFIIGEKSISPINGKPTITIKRSFSRNPEDEVIYAELGFYYNETPGGYTLEGTTQNSGCGTTFSTYGGYYDGGDTIVLYRFNNLPDFDLTVVDTCVWKLHK